MASYPPGRRIPFRLFENFSLPRFFLPRDATIARYICYGPVPVCLSVYLSEGHSPVAGLSKCHSSTILCCILQDLNFEPTTCSRRPSVLAELLVAVDIIEVDYRLTVN